MIKVSIPLGSGLLPPNVDQRKAVFNSFIAAGRASIGPGGLRVAKAAPATGDGAAVQDIFCKLSLGESKIIRPFNL
jgi:hypothetical protein